MLQSDLLKRAYAYIDQHRQPGRTLFFVGLHQPSDAIHFMFAFVSVKRLWRRVSGFLLQKAAAWIMDSGAFTEIKNHGRYRHSPAEYAERIERWAANGFLLAAIGQDYMCESFILQITGLTVADHQRLTIERYDELIEHVHSAYVMPVLQGFEPHEYVDHIRQYGDRLAHGAWVGVGSVCKRQGDISAIEEVLIAIHDERPDLRLHGFGVKTTALKSSIVNKLLYTADSMAWSAAARFHPTDSPNDYRVAERFETKIKTQPVRQRTYNNRLPGIAGRAARRKSTPRPARPTVATAAHQLEIEL